MTKQKEFYGHGKLLLTGEYAVLDGAKAIALPTKLGQRLIVKPTRGSDLIWESRDSSGNVWFDANISLFDFKPLKTSNEEIAASLGKLLKNSVRLNSEFLDKWNGYKVRSELEFPNNWGLGSSSTLTYIVALWADVNPFFLHFKISNGSGYDIACAGADGPIEYSLKNDEIKYAEIDFEPSFSDKLYFVHLNKKQDSEAEIKKYLKEGKSRKEVASKISAISEKIVVCKALSEFESLIAEHEDIMAKSLKVEKVKDELFSDYWGSMKSLGAWGGDFALATSDKSAADTTTYFKDKGYSDVLTYNDLILT